MSEKDRTKISQGVHRDIPREIIAWIQEQLYRMKGLQIYYIEEEAMDAFWRTLIGNVTHETEEATQECRTFFNA
jgi:hypothetical protein